MSDAGCARRAEAGCLRRGRVRLAAVRRLFASLGLLLLLLTVAAPVAEAVVACGEVCADGDAAGDCGADNCCSCCVHARFAPPAGNQAPRQPGAGGYVVVVERAPTSATPRGILHVPRLRTT
jgi:hypothetical protein